MRPALAPKSKPKLSNLRPRYEPATLEDALFAAEGLTEDREQQLEIVSELMALPVPEVRVLAEPYFRANARRVVIETGRRSGGAVIVEMKAPRRVVIPPRGTMTFHRAG